MANSQDIQQSIISLQTRRSKLGAKKQTLQAEISTCREMLKYIKQGHESFNEVAAKKNKLILETQEIDEEIMELKNQIKRRQALKEEVKATEEPKLPAIVAEIIAMRDRYLTFAGDKTRIASMRAMAADAANDLTKILKTA